MITLECATSPANLSDDKFKLKENNIAQRTRYFIYVVSLSLLLIAIPIWNTYSREISKQDVPLYNFNFSSVPPKDYISLEVKIFKTDLANGNSRILINKVQKFSFMFAYFY
jgi:hypothetical protein